MRLISHLVVIGIAFCLATCKKSATKSDNDDNTGGNNNPVLKYIKFKVVCGYPNQPMFAGVRIFDESNGDRSLSANSTLEGMFCSMMKFNVSGSYRIELYEVPTGNCVTWVKQIRYSEEPWWFVDNCSEATVVEWGPPYCSGNPPRTDCWQQ